MGFDYRFFCGGGGGGVFFGGFWSGLCVVGEVEVCGGEGFCKVLGCC